MATRSKQHAWLVRLSWAIPSGLFALAWFLEPDPSGHGTHRQLGLAPCSAREWLGAPCPGCGVTTSAVELLHGRPLDSFATQPFGFVLTLGAAALFFWIWRAHLAGRDAWQELMQRAGIRWVRVLLAAAAAGWAWRVAVERLADV